MLLRKPRSYAEVYNDIDGEVVNVFRVLRNPEMCAELQRRLRLTPFARAEFKDAYIIAGDDIERARKIIALAFMGFGSASQNREHMTGFRGTSHRAGTTPAHDWRNYAEMVTEFVERLRWVTIECCEALTLIPRHDSAGTLFYVDPPYPMSTRSVSAKRNRCYVVEMSDADHEALASALHQVKGYVVLSSYPSAMYQALYKGWKKVTCKTFADGARERKEVLWLNPAASEAIA